MRKRILSLALCLALALSLLPTGALAAESEEWIEVDGIVGGKIKFNESTGVIENFEKTVTSADIPSEIHGVTVTSIGKQAFLWNSSLTSVTIPNSVTSIGEAAFYGCSSLASVTIPGSVVSIGESAFGRCSSLTSVTISNGVTSLGLGAFAECTSLTSIEIPDSVTSLGPLAFQECSSLASVKLPDRVTSLGYSLFNGCSSLRAVTIPEGVTSIEDWMFSGCSNLTSVTIPENVTSIGGSVFSGCRSLTSVTIPDSVTSIGSSAFYGCNSLTSVTIPNGVTSLENYVFSQCRGLTEVTIPEGVTSIGDEAFLNCNSLTSVTIPEGVVSLGASVFEECTSLTSVTIPDSVTSIGEGAFYNCIGLSSVAIPDGVTSLSKDVFLGCIDLTSIVIPDGVTSIGDSAFQWCDCLASIVIPDSVTSIGTDTFRGCYSLTDVYYAGTEEEWEQISIDSGNTCLTNTMIYFESSGAEDENPAGWFEVDGVLGGKLRFNEATGVIVDCEKSVVYANIPSEINGVAVTTIGDGAFAWHYNLAGVVIPESVTTIGSYAFYFYHETDMEVYYPGTEEDWNKISIGEENSVLKWTTIHFNSTGGGSGAIPVWTEVEGIEGGRLRFDIATGTILDCEETVTRANIPSEILGVAVTAIGDSAFQWCTDLTSVTIANSVTSIGNVAFYACSNLTSVVIPESVTDIGECAFWGCDSLSSVTIPDSIVSISNGTFGDCSSLTEVEIPNSVTSIGDSAFAYCSNLTKIIIPDGLISIGSGAFARCDNLTSVTIPKSVTSIGGSAFSECDRLKKLQVADGNPVFYVIDGVLFQKGQNGDILHTYLIAKEEKTYSVPEGVTIIGESAFLGSSLENITLGSVEEIRDYAFFGCLKLSSITFPVTVKRLASEVIALCDNVEYVVFQGEAPDFGEEGSLTAYGNGAVKYIYVPEGSLEVYTAALDGKCSTGAVIVEGEYAGIGTAREKIEELEDTPSVEAINAAATSIVRLSKADAAQISDDDLMKVEGLLRDANKGKLNVTVDTQQTEAEVAIQGAALASGLVENQDESGSISGNVNITVTEVTDAWSDPNDLLVLDFTMCVNDEQKNLQAPVIVSVTLPDALKGQSFDLIHQNDYGIEESIPYTMDGDVCTFRAASFSSYIFRLVVTEDRVAYTLDPEIPQATLYLAEYTQEGKMVSLKTWTVSGTGNQPFDKKDGMNYKAFLLDNDRKPVGTTEIQWKNTQ